MVKNIVVIGSGTRGRCIAYTSAVTGFQVKIHDISEESLHQVKQYLIKEMGKGVITT